MTLTVPRCVNTETCAFFTAEIGFSPALKDAMRERYCLGDNSGCARWRAGEILGGLDQVPHDMLPSDEAVIENM